MLAAVQSGGRSPKPLKGPSTQQLKSGSDSVQSSAFSSQPKGKKKGEKGDQSSESKRECSSNADGRDPGDFRLDSMINTEIAKITDKGGIINNDAVEKLVQLMQLDRGERKFDLAGRLLIADVIAATNRNDCLGRFVKLRGVPVLDNWLQEAHRRKNGDGSPKEGDKSVEELLLTLLCALAKFPVELNALQTCNIGKSVNHLRGHKNLEIQKKAKSLVDTWKKRVDAEMTKLSDARSIGSIHTASWPGKQGLSEVYHGGNRCACSSEVAVKSSLSQPSPCKPLPVKIGYGDSTVKSSPTSSGSLKWSTTLSTSVSIGTKDLESNASGSTRDTELPFTTIKEEKISTACQPQNNSQPCSDDLAKAMGTLLKEDTRSSNAGLTNTSKTSGSAPRHRKSLNGLAETDSSGISDGAVTKSSFLSQNTTSDKVPLSGVSGPVGERSTDMPVADLGNSHKLIVRLSNFGRSPAPSTSGGSFKDPLTSNMTLSPGISEKNEHIDQKTKVKSDVCQPNIPADVNKESCQIDDSKILAGSDDVDRSPPLLDEELGTVEIKKEVDVVATSSEPKLKSFQSSLSSTNALIESHVKYPEAGSFLHSGDDLGMNLLASVAAGEMSKSDLVSPTASPEENTALEDTCTVNKVRSKFSSEDVKTQVGQPDDNPEYGSEKHGPAAVSSQVQDKVQQNVTDHLTYSFDDVKCIQPLDKKGECREQCPVSAAVSCKNAEHDAKSESKYVNVVTDGHTSLSTLPVDTKDGSGEAYQLLDKQRASGPATDGLPNGKRKVRGPSSDRSKLVDHVHENIADGSVALCDGDDIDHVSPGNGKCEKESDEGNSSCPLDKQIAMDEELHDAISSEKQLPSTVALCPDDVSQIVNNTMIPTCESEQCSKPMEKVSSSPEASSVVISFVQDASAKCGFDLNEGFSDEGNTAEPIISSPQRCSSAVHLPSTSPFTVSHASSGLSIPITVAAPAKGPFVPPEAPPKSKGEPSWKGSAATSAFHPEEPQKNLEIRVCASGMPSSDAAGGKQSYSPLDI